MMNSRMDRYKDENVVPKRSDKNKPLYTTIYNAYDEFENLIIPSNSKEIDLSTLKKEVTSRSEYRESKLYDSMVKKDNVKNIESETKSRESNKNNIYDINELLDKAKQSKREDEKSKLVVEREDYLKKLNLGDIKRTNLEVEKELFEELKEEHEEESSLMNTNSLSLDILSDLKGVDDNTIIEAPIKDELIENFKSKSFIAGKYEFDKEKFDNKNENEEIDNDLDISNDKEISKEEDNDDFFDEPVNNNIGLKICLLVVGLIIVLVVAFYLFKYFNKI